MASRVIKVKTTLSTSVSSSSCLICNYKSEVREYIEHLRIVLGYTIDEVHGDVSSHWEEWRTEGVVDQDSTPPSKDTLKTHFRDHCKLTPSGRYSADPQIVRMSLVQESLQSRCELYKNMSGVFNHLLGIAQEKLARLEDLYGHEAVFHERFRNEMARYRLQYAQYLEDVREHQEAGDTNYSGSPPKLPNLVIPSGIIEEEQRTLRLLDRARQQATEMSKVLTYEDGFTSYVVIELESLLRDLYEDLLPKIVQVQNQLSSIVPGDRHDKLRSYLREFAIGVQSSWKVKFKTFLKDISGFTKGLKN